MKHSKTSDEYGVPLTTTDAPEPTQMTVLLTGSTGSLGTYLLHELLNSPSVSHIYALNRDSPTLARTRQSQCLESRGLTTDLTRVSFHAWDGTRPDLGLLTSIYTSIQSSITHILHNAYPVDFLRTVASFAPSILAAKRLVDLAHSSQHRPRIFFISTINVAGNWAAVPGARPSVPEAPINDWRVARLGYGQSKLIIERMLVAAADTPGGPNVDICRVGQLAGPVLRGENGVWSPQEWLPSLIQSSRWLGKLPARLGPLDDVDWVPVDVCARVVVELLGNVGGASAVSRKWRSKRNLTTRAGTDKGTVRVFHVVNPCTVIWSSLLPAVCAALSGGTQEASPDPRDEQTQHLSSRPNATLSQSVNPEASSTSPDIEIVPFTQWVKAVQQAGRDVSTIKQNPAMKLLSFFKTIDERARRFPDIRRSVMETKETVKMSRELAGVQPVNAEWVRLWVAQWNRAAEGG